MATEKKNKEEFLTSNDLEYILEVNKKSIEINIEVEKQNEQVISLLEDFQEKNKDSDKKLDSLGENQKTILRITEENQENLKNSQKKIEEIQLFSKEVMEIKKKIEEIEKNLFRLVIILGSAGIGTLVTIIQAYLKK